MTQGKTQDQGRVEDAPQLSGQYQPIEDYGIIGDLHTVALVGKQVQLTGAVYRALMLPVFLARYSTRIKGGSFVFNPHKRQGWGASKYIPETNILVTRFLTVDGVGEITDFMPIQLQGTVTHQHHIIRAVHVVRGSLAFEMIADRHLITHVIRMKYTCQKTGLFLIAKASAWAWHLLCLWRRMVRGEYGQNLR